MKKQKVVFWMKRQDKNSEKQLNEVEISNLPGKGFRIMIVKMIQDLGKTVEKMEEMFYYGPRRTNKQINNTLEGISNRIAETEEWINDLEDRMMEVTARK